MGSNHPDYPALLPALTAPFVLSVFQTRDPNVNHPRFVIFWGYSIKTYQDFDFLYSPGQTVGMPRMQTCSPWPLTHGAPGSWSAGLSVNTEKGSEKVSKHCTAS